MGILHEIKDMKLMSLLETTASTTRTVATSTRVYSPSTLRNAVASRYKNFAPFSRTATRNRLRLPPTLTERKELVNPRKRYPRTSPPKKAIELHIFDHLDPGIALLLIPCWLWYIVWSKIARLKKTRSFHPSRNERAGWREPKINKKASLIKFISALLPY